MATTAVREQELVQRFVHEVVNGRQYDRTDEDARGRLPGIEPTHRTVEITGNATHRVRDGKVAETWAIWDFLGTLQQLGVIDAPSA